MSRSHTLRSLMSPLARVAGVCLLAGLSTVTARAETFEGMLNGLKCAIEGIICPIDKLDPIIAAEVDFVLQQPDGSFYFIPNLDRGVKTRYALDGIRVNGTRIGKYNAVMADLLQVERDGHYRTVWSMKMQAEGFDYLRQPGSTRR